MVDPAPSNPIPDLSYIPSRLKEKSSKPKAPPEDNPDHLEKSKKTEKDTDISKIRAKHAEEQAAQRCVFLSCTPFPAHRCFRSSSRQTEIERMEADIRKLTRRTGGGNDSDDDEPMKKKPKKSYLEEEMAKYTKNRGASGKKGKKKDESDVLDVLSKFRSKLKSVPSLGKDEEGDGMDVDREDGEESKGGEGDPGIEVDDDTGFLGHSFYAPKDNSEEVIKAERDYEVIDPRQRGARAREEERERKAAQKKQDGGRGSRR